MNAGDGSAAIRSDTWKAALAHPTVQLLAGLLKIDLSNEAQHDAVVSLAERNMKASNSRTPTLSVEPCVASGAAPRPTITPYYVQNALNFYCGVDELVRNLE